MNDRTYNGWSNRETWLTNLWLTNDEGTQSHCRELAESIFESARSSETLTRFDRYRIDFAKALEDLVTEGNPLQDSPGLYLDLLSGAIREVDWREIASGMFEEFEDTTSDS